jgi:hypothetical protein
VEARSLALIPSVDDTPLGDSLKLRKDCILDGLPNECLRHLSRRLLAYLTHLFNHCLRLSHFPKPWKEAKVMTLLKPGKDTKFMSD